MKSSSILKELEAAGVPATAETAAEKKNYAEQLSRHLAMRVAAELRRHKGLGSVLPDADGQYQESKARTNKGFKKLDVNYSTTQLGLGLGVSIKTFSFKDKKSERYTKNYTARDNELRAEAEDYHERQPFAVLVALIFMPEDSCLDGKKARSSFAQAVSIFRWRGGRHSPYGKATLFERVFLGVYQPFGERRGDVWFFDVADPPPQQGVPAEAKRQSLEQMIETIIATYDSRNNPQFRFEDEAAK